MSARVRVLVHATAPGGDLQAVTHAYHLISRTLAGTPGLLGNELLRSAHRPGEYAVLSEWASVEAFRAWEGGPGHRAATAPLRPFQSGFAVYVVEAAYADEESPA
ncbi:antibiotic biosynthesis monooxygenase [Nonomuraea monospora]|uniref:Antibiotic biosynthesis monooxygenase n=1 Tax=Nonomuraea monospora TaxID=568818 RepID=A0ABN3C5D4_9ACTN